MDHEQQLNPSLYQLIGPIEEFYQMVPIHGTNRRRRNFVIHQRHQQQNNNMVLIPLPYLDNFEPEEATGREEHYQLVGPIGVTGHELLLVDEVLLIFLHFIYSEKLQQ